MAAQHVPADAGAGVVDRPVVTDRLAEVAPMVRRMCIHRLGVWDGEDAAQEVLARLWKLTRQRPDYTGAPLFGWAVANVRFQVLTVYRRHQARPLLGQMADISDRVLLDPAAGPEAHAERLESAREATGRVRELLGRLTLRERQVLLASGLGMRSDAETAARLGMTVHNVAVTRQRALARMREFAGVLPAGTLNAEQRRRRQARLTRLQPEGARPQQRPGQRLPVQVHEAGRAALRDGWQTDDLIGEFGVSDTLVRRWRADNAAADTARAAAGPSRHTAGTAAVVSTAELVARAHQALTAAADRDAAGGGPARPGWMTVDLVERVTASITAARAAGQRYGQPRLATEHGLTGYQARLLLHHITGTPPRPGWMTTDLIGRVSVSIAAARAAGQWYGRPRLIAEYGLTSHQAQALLQHIATSTASTTSTSGEGPGANQALHLISHTNPQAGTRAEGHRG